MKFLRAYLRTNLRGRTRVTSLLARLLGSLQFVPIKIADCEPFYVDLRKVNHDLLKGSPWDNAPWEQAEQRLMRQIVEVGSVVFDIGANIGLHTVLLSKLIGDSGRLCVFEPNPELLPQLRMTVEGLGNATLFPFALSNQTEVATLFVPEDDSMGSLANWTMGSEDVGEVRTLNCEVRRIDDLIDSQMLPQPDFIKCDVEGAELMIFQGGHRSLSRSDAPIILFEANVHNAHGFGLTVGAAMSYLAGLAPPKYSFFAVEEDGILKQTETIHPVHSNVLAVPESKLDRVSQTDKPF